MDIVEAINQRKSIRAFKPDPVPKDVLKEIMEQAQRAPSWANTQPWEFVIAGGQQVKEIGQAYIKKVEAGEQMHPDLAAPREFPEPFDSRRRSVGRKLFEVKGITREDREQRRLWGLQGLKMFDAPNIIYICTERYFYLQGDHLNVWPVFDCGLIAENIMLLAPKYGLGTIPAIQAVAYPDILRKVLSIPDVKLLVLGIGIGYPDWDEPANNFRTERDALDNIVTWHGFD